MDYKDYYKILGVERDAAQDDIKRAYRKLVRKFHPDANTGADAPEAEARFKEVGEAYEVLGDPEKRAAYDQLGADWKEGQSFKAPPDWDDGFEFTGRSYSNADQSGFSDFFEDLFAARRGASGRANSTQQARREFHAHGQDSHAKIVISLQEAYDGGSRDFTLRAPELDETGHVVLRERSIRVKIPKGMTEGKHIRLPGKGAPGVGQGKAGDLYLEVAIKADPPYSIEDRDVYLELPVTPWEAALGARIRVPTPAGAVEMKVPAHAQTGKKLRIKGRGIPGKPAGNFYAVLKIVIPPKESEAARKLYEQMSREMDYDPRANLGV